jgi:hypothetical protein
MDALAYHVFKQCDHGKKFFNEDASLDKVRDFYNSIDVKILTSSSECKSRVLLEAMAMGLPCISTDVGTARMMLGTEWVVPANPDENVVANMNALLNIFEKYPQVRKDVGKRNRAWVVEHFSWKIQMAKWDAIYEALIAGDFKTIKEISDSWIAPFEDLFNSAEPFQPREDLKPRNPVSVRNKPIEREGVVEASDQRLLNFFEDLDQHHIFYWLRNGTCLNAIRGSISGASVSIGVKYPNNKLAVEKIAKEHGYNLDIEVDDGQRTKEYGVAGKIFNVPMPVKTYLEIRFGKGCVDDCN